VRGLALANEMIEFDRKMFASAQDGKWTTGMKSGLLFRLRAKAP
jgi:hypothetical protein